MQGFVHMMQVVKRIFYGKVIPVTRIRHRLIEIAILHGDDIGIEEFGKFLDISLTQGIVGIISFCHENGRTVESTMAKHHSLFKGTPGSILAIQLLLDEEHIFLREMCTLQCFHITYSWQSCQSLTSLS